MLIRPAIHQKDKETEVAVWCRMIMWITVDLVLEEEWKECIKTTRCFGGFRLRSYFVDSVSQMVLPSSPLSTTPETRSLLAPQGVQELLLSIRWTKLEECDLHR